MKTEKLEKRIKSRLKKHYVRKDRHESLEQEVRSLNAQVQQLQEALRDRKDAGGKQKAAGKTSKAKKTTARVAKPGKKLTRIRGIGPVLESKLKKLGISELSQIADWEKSDVESVSEKLDYKGRIEPADWVKQAKEMS